MGLHQRLEESYKDSFTEQKINVIMTLMTILTNNTYFNNTQQLCQGANNSGQIFLPFFLY